MKFFAILLFLIAFSLNLFAQTPDAILATANGRQFTAADLTPNVRQLFEQQEERIVEIRKNVFSQIVTDALLEAEAAAHKATVESLVKTELKRRTVAPTDEQIKAVYDANRAAIGNRQLADVRPQIIAFLQREGEQKALGEYVENLKAKHKLVILNDSAAPDLKPSDVLVTVAGKPITKKDLDEAAKEQVYELRAEVYDQASQALEEAVYLNLVAAEAQSRNLTLESLIASEVSDRMREFSEDERERLENAFKTRLFQKYGAKFQLAEPEPFVQSISVDDDPSKGSASAPVTVVMFTDLQCPACAATHPVLNQILAEYGDRVRLVVRDYPLTEIHENAFKAAEAANAARTQGKFFEYVELLYKNQNSLDTASLKRFADEIGLNRKQFDADLDGGKFAAEVEKDLADGAKYGVRGTPTIFVNGIRVRELSARHIRRLVERALKK